MLDPPPLYEQSTCAAGASGETGCTLCVDSCPYQAMSLRHRPEGTVIDIDPGVCRRCGACTGLCPTSSLERSFQPDAELYAAASGAIDPDSSAPVVVFGCARSRRSLDGILGENTVFIELRSLLVLNETHLLQALRSGASGVLLAGCSTCHHGAPHLAKAALEFVRALIGDDDAVMYVEDDHSPESTTAMSGFVQGRGEERVISPGSLVDGGRRREILSQLLGNDLFIDAFSPPLVGDTFATVTVNNAECVMCGACSRACPTDALGFDPTSGTLDFSHIDCVNCGLCLQACPADVVTLTPGLEAGARLGDRKVLVQDEVVPCAGCGQPYIPRRLFEHARAVRERQDEDLSTSFQMELCGSCRIIDWETEPPVNGRQPGVGLPMVDRRDFLKAVGAGTAGAAMLAFSPKPAAAEAPARPIERKRLAMVIDMDRCIGCHACTAICKAENHVPLGVFRDWVEEHELGTFPDARPVFLPKLCNHCDDPGCMRACPTGAIFRRADGIVDINHDICIGCRACNQACPYGSTFMDPVRGTADKCNFCSHRIDQGLNPACVDVCPTGCRIFGDLDDPNSAPSSYLKDHQPTVLRQELGLGPNVKYVGLPGELNR
ncbi:MAG: 4Fe-4S dicluster domain-containing protein [Acidimicrobiia bacterium]